MYVIFLKTILRIIILLKYLEFKFQYKHDVKYDGKNVEWICYYIQVCQYVHYER